MSKTAVPFTIDLAKSSNPHALSAEQFLNVTQYIFLFQRMLETVQKIPSFKDNLNDSQNIVGYQRVHDVTAVNGNRGSGKTTFLLSALTLLKNPTEFEKFAKDKDIKKLDVDKLCVLDIIDPTLFACREHLLHAILCKISEKVHKSTTQKRAMNCLGQDSTCVLEKWEKNVHRLARGLNAIGEIREGNEKDVSASGRWEEASFTMQADMKNIQSSMDLERCFHRVVRDALSILGKDAFVLALDDIDTRPNIGWHVLEVIRRYLTTPQILIIMSGDLDLLTSIIRREHANGLGIEVTKPYANKAPYKERLDGLTEQYLLKILRANARINLGNFISAMQANDLNVLRESDASEVMIENSNYKGIQYTLQELLDSFFDFIGCNAQQERALFRHTLLNTSCRTEVQVLSALFEYKRNKQNGHELAFRLCEIYFMQLLNFGLDPLDIQEILQSPQGLTRIMDVLFRAGYAADGLELLPDSMSSYDNEALLVLHANLAQAMKTDSKLAFEYMFKACWLREVMRYRGETSSEHYEHIAKYIKLNSIKSLSYTTKNIAATLWPNIAPNPTRLTALGTVRLFGESIRRNSKFAVQSMYKMDFGAIKEDDIPGQLLAFYDGTQCTNSPYARSLTNTPVSLQNNILSWHKELIPLGMMSVDKNNDSYPIFSITAMLSILGDLLMIDKKAPYDVFNNVFRKHCFIDSFPPFVEKNSKKDAQSDSTNDSNFNDIEDMGPTDKTKIFDALRAWRNSITFNHYNIHPTLFARIMERFCNGLKKVDISNLFLGKYIHRCLVLFFNSILVEEILLGSTKIEAIEKNILLNDPTGSDKIFQRNLSMINICIQSTYGQTISIKDKLKENCPLFSAIFSCPLWSLYLDNTSELWNYYQNICESCQTLKDFSSVTYSAQNKFDNLYPLLNSIAIPKQSLTSLNIPNDDPRTELGFKFGIAKELFRKGTKLNVHAIRNHYQTTFKANWIGSTETDPPHEFITFCQKLMDDSYKDFGSKKIQIQIIWDIIRNFKG